MGQRACRKDVVGRRHVVKLRVTCPRARFGTMALRTALFVAVPVLAVLCSQAAALAQDGAARYAGVQLEVAQSFLRQARAAAAREDRGRAGRLAWQASIDA